MKVYILADLECVAGIVNFTDYCRPEYSKYYEHAKELATLEVNAAIDGLLETGATEIVVWDGHGPGGLNPSLLHPEAKIACGRPMDYPHFIDQSFDAMIITGQHAMANADGGHLCHSGSFSREKWLLNGKEIGEIGLTVLKAAYFKVPTVMLTGDSAACEEARSYLPEIHTVPVIWGQKRGSTEGMTSQEAIAFNAAAIHLAPEQARKQIRETAAKCLDNLKTHKLYWLEPPYEMTRVTRPETDKPGRTAVNRSDDYMDLLSQKPEYDN
jgi:D-amino peptidase